MPTVYKQFLTNKKGTVINAFFFKIYLRIWPLFSSKIFSPHGVTALSGPGPLQYRDFTITLRHTRSGRTTLDEWSDRRSDLYLTTHNTRKIQISMPLTRFEPAIPAGERPQTHALDRSPHWDRTSRVIDKQNAIWKHREGFIFWSAHDDAFQHYKSQELLHRGGRKATSVGACGGGVGPYSRTLGRGKGAHKAQPRPLRLFWFLLLIEMPRIPRTQRERDRTPLQRMVTTTGIAHACLLW